MQENKQQPLTPDEMAEVMGKKTHTATFEATGESAEKIAALATPPEPFYFYMVTITIQKRPGWITRNGKEIYVDKFKPRIIKGIVRSNAYSKIRPAVGQMLAEYLEADDAYIKKYDARKLETDFFIPEA